MTSPDRDRRRRGGPGAGRRRDWQGWNGPRWYDESAADRPEQGRGGPGWGGRWGGPGWVGDWRETSWDDPRDAGRDGRRGDVPAKRVRIGDAERDQAVALLSEHFVAGRLTQAEFEERSEQATRARYSDDFDQLFDDLPSTTELVPHGAARPLRRPGPPPAFMMIAPFLMVGLVISSIALTAPWLLWGLFWIVMISGMTRRRWQN
ncbi:DUF1707 SHOCT-like domain-containing protein [Kribbella sp. NPDC054772]